MFTRSELKTRAKEAFAQQRSPLILAFAILMLLTMLAMTPYYMGFMPTYGAMISQLQSDPMMLSQSYNPAATIGPMYFGLFAMTALLAIVFVIQVAYTGMALKALDRKAR